MPSQGVRLTLVPQWGRTASGVAALWGQAAGLPGQGAGQSSGAQVTGELSYGRPGLTPFTTISVQPDGHGVGVGVRASGVRVAADRIQRVGIPVTHGLRVQAEWRF